MALKRRLRTALTAVEFLVGGLGTAMLALVLLPLVGVVLVASLAGVGLPLLPAAARLLRTATARERERLDITPPLADMPDGWRDVLRSRDLRRELAWLVLYLPGGLLLGILGLGIPFNVIRDGTFVLWYWMVPSEFQTSSLGWPVVHGWLSALSVSLLGVVWLLIVILFGPPAARLQAWPGRRLLGPPPGTDLSLRVQELTATRAAALDAHAAELRRIERSLHDGTQNRLVGVTVLLGAAHRSLSRTGQDPVAAELVEKAQAAAEQALAELRGVVRSILPPVLEDRGLAGALATLAADCGVHCVADVDVPGRCAASVEATAYFVAAEALTNVVKHSAARNAEINVRRDGDRLMLRVSDDGRGGANEHGGSGILGIRRRVEAYDGELTLTSPVGGPTTLEVRLPCGS